MSAHAGREWPRVLREHGKVFEGLAQTLGALKQLGMVLGIVSGARPEVLDLLRGEGILRPSAGTAPELRPIARDVQALLRELEHQFRPTDDVVMQDRGEADRIGQPLVDDLPHMFDHARAASGDHGDRDASGDPADQFDVEPATGSFPVD